MKPALFKLYTILLFGLLQIFTCCKGQIKSNVLNNTEIDSSTASDDRPTIKIKSSQNQNVHCSLKDRNGNLWFGTTGDGVYRYDGKTFTHFTEKDGLGNNYVSQILEDRNGEIWIGTNSGISRYNGKKFSNTQLGVTSANYLNTIKQSGDARNAPPINAVWSLMQDKSGKIWIGTFDGGVYCYDGKKFSHFLHNDNVINKSSIKLKAVNTILEDKNGKIWFATWFEGLCVYDGKEIVSFKPNNEVWYASLLKDKNGDIWIGRRQNGLIVYDGKDFNNISQGGTLDSCGVHPMLQDKAGNIWFGSIHKNMALRDTKGGLWRYDGKQFKNFSIKDGLVNHNVWSAVEDGSGNLWFGAVNNTLYKYDGKLFISFTE